MWICTGKLHKSGLDHVTWAPKLGSPVATATTVSIEILRLDSGCSSVCPTRWKTVHYVKNNSILTPTQKADLINYHLRIHCELTRFCAIQKIFMPAVLPFLSSINQTIAPPTGYPKWKQDDGSEIIKYDSSDKPLPIKLQWLFLLSDLPPDIHASCHPVLDTIKKQLWEAQCRSALVQVQTQMYIKSRLVTYKQCHALHQGMNTRMCEELQKNGLKAKLHQAKYNVAWTALLMLVGTNEEGFEWKEMRDSDIWCMEDPKQEKKCAEWEKSVRRRRGPHSSKGTQKTLMDQAWVKAINRCCGFGRVWAQMQMVRPGCEMVSWLLLFTKYTAHYSFAGLRVQWMKSRVCSQCWVEEVLLLKEEMCRALAYLDH